MSKFMQNQQDFIEEYLVVNFSLTGAKTRRAMLNGREHIVVPMTMIVPGVLAGSKGPLLYPADEVGKDPTPWNGMPVTYNHPVRNGRNVSARDPEVLDSQGIGVVLRARTGDKLRAEAWIDVERANAIDPRIVENVERGLPQEISTGLFTDNHPAPPGAAYNGKPYAFIARNYRPDHLAILGDQKGACSVRDGCGLMVNSNPEGHNQYTAHALAAGSAARKATRSAVDAHSMTPGSGSKEEHSLFKQNKSVGKSPMTADQHMNFAKQHESMAKAQEGKLQQAIARDNQRGTDSSKTINAHSAAAIAHSYAADLHRKAAKAKSVTSNQELIDNDWTEYNKKRRGIGGSKPSGKEWDRANRRQDAKERKLGGKAPLSPRETNQHGKPARGLMVPTSGNHRANLKASEMAAKFTAGKKDAHKNATAAVQAHLSFAKKTAAHAAKHGYDAKKEITKHHENAKKAAIKYSQTRAKQHEQVAKAYAKAGNHKAAAHFMARANYHNQHISKLSKSKPTLNELAINSFFPSGERAFVKNQLTTNANSKRKIRRRLTANIKGMSVDEQANAVQEAFRTANPYPQPTDVSDQVARMQAVHDDHHIYTKGGEMYKQKHKLTDDGKCELVGKPQQVRRIVSYEPVGNANPEGHNQYTGKSSAKATVPEETTMAHQASVAAWRGHHATPNRYDRDANDAANAGDYVKAAKFHKFAAQTHEQRASESAEHKKAGEAHRNAEKMHTQLAKAKAATFNESQTITNQGEEMKLTAVQRAAIIDQLTSNSGCGCWTPDDRDHLSGLSDDRLSGLKASHEGHLATNSGGHRQSGEPRRLTEQEFMAMAPASIQEVIGNAADIVRKEKDSLIAGLVANLGDAEKKSTTELLAGKSLDEVRLFARLAKSAAPTAAAPTENSRRFIYGPTARNTIVDNASEVEDDKAEEMMPVAFDWNEVAKLNRQN